MNDSDKTATSTIGATECLDTMRSRARRCVCSYCGGQLELREIVYSNCETARTEIFCSECGRMDWGCEPEVYSIAESYLRRNRFDSNKDMAASLLKDEMNRAELTKFLTWSLETLGVVGEDGFACNIELDQTAITSMLSWSRDELSGNQQGGD